MITLRVAILTAAAVAISISTFSADLGETPEQVGATMKRGLVDVKMGLDRHMVEVFFAVDHNVTIFTFLDGRVCREAHIEKNDAPQDDYITLLLHEGQTAGHTWNVMATTGDKRRWLRDDGKVDILYGDVMPSRPGVGSAEKPPIKHVLLITAPEYLQHLLRVQANEGRDIPGFAPSVKEIRSRIESVLSH